MASKQKPRNGASTQRPKNGKSVGQGLAPCHPSDRAVSVLARRGDSFNRAGLRFTASAPTIVKESEVGPDRFAQICAEPMLRVEEV